MARKLHTTLEPGDVILIPPGNAASITFLDKSGRRSRVQIECDAPVTIDRPRTQSALASNTQPPMARRPVPRTA